MAEYDIRGGESQTTRPASRWNLNRIHQAGLAGLFGGLLWAVWPFGAEIALADFYQTRVMDSVAIAYSLLTVGSLGLMIVGVLGLYHLHVGTFGRLGTIGAFISGGALAVMAIGDSDMTRLLQISTSVSLQSATVCRGSCSSLDWAVVMANGNEVG